MKVLLTRRLHDFAVKKIRKRHQVEIYTGKVPIPKDVLVSKIKDKDGLICYPYDKIDSDVINAGIKLKAISTFSVGYNHIDVKAALERGIIVSYTPEVLTRATADLAMALVLSLFRRVCEGDGLIHKKEWKTILGPYEFLGTDMYGKTLGIFGMGRIGKAVAKRALGFDMKLLYHNRKRLSSREEKSLNARYVSLDELFRRSDVVSIHVPHTPKTHGIVNLKLFKNMKKTSFLVNTARGKIINEKDLVVALKKKTIAGAALDVFQNEPIDASNPLIGLKNVLMTPHIGSATVETRRAMAEITVKNLMLSLARKKPIYQVKVESDHLGRF
jgi:glyoxylate reductase